MELNMKGHLSEELIQKAVDFHGHWCPGLAIGLRAGEYVLQNLGRAQDEDIVAVVETDMCGVDAIQVLTGCTFGKGNLLFNDYGKMAFTFFRRGDGKSVRLVFDTDGLGGVTEEFLELNRKAMKGGVSAEEQKKLDEFRSDWARRIMDADLDKVFAVQESATSLPRKARIMASLACQECGEKVMETRVRRFEGRTLCIPCFERITG
jgi:formylmethanofuran dehydrogenase subunit E